MPEQVKTKLNELMAGLKNESSTARLETIETIGTLRNREAMDAFKNPDGFLNKGENPSGVNCSSTNNVLPQ